MGTEDVTGTRHLASQQLGEAEEPLGVPLHGHGHSTGAALLLVARATRQWWTSSSITSPHQLPALGLAGMQEGDLCSHHSQLLHLPVSKQIPVSFL